MNKTRLDILKSSLGCAFGLFLFGCATYIIIQADIGVSPWDVLNFGIAKTLNIIYGNASIVVSAVVITLDLLLKEKIGLGTVLDAVIVGKTVDLLNFLHILPKSESLVLSIIMMAIGFVLAGYSQYFYMKSALSQGPRDTLQIALARRIPKLSVGTVNVILLSFILLLGWLLGGTVKIGSFFAAFGYGIGQNIAFKLTKFDPKKVEHQGFIESMKVIFGK